MSDATLGEWYWNGFIGFKIPSLTYFIEETGTIPGFLTSGNFTPPETITQTASGATARLVAASNTQLTIIYSSVTGTPTATDVWVGDSSGANFTPTAVPVFLGNGFIPLGPVNSVAEPSTYTITFTTATNGLIPAQATVYNNIYGYREGLIQGQPWGYVNTIIGTDPATVDELVAFQIDTPGHFIQRNVGNVINVSIVPTHLMDIVDAYDITPYDMGPYDADRQDVTVPYPYDRESFPLFFGHGSVIWFKASGTGTSLNPGDTIVIDKSFNYDINLQVTGSSMNYPELAAVNDWIPIKLRYFDNVDPASIVDGVYTPTSVADYSDLALYIQGYAAADPDQLIFSILSPRYVKTDRTSGSTLTFDQTFFTTYLPFGTHYSIQVEPDQSYGQHIRTKITENLKILSIGGTRPAVVYALHRPHTPKPSLDTSHASITDSLKIEVRETVDP